MSNSFEIKNSFTINKEFMSTLPGATESNIVFGFHNKEILRLEENGDIFIHGKLTENDKEVVEGLRKLLSSSGY